MDIKEHRRIWDASVEDWISPISQKMIFQNGNNHSFSFSTSFNTNSTSNFPNETWSCDIPASYYHAGVNYSVSFEFHYTSGGTKFNDKCTGRFGNETYDHFDTGYWACLDSSQYHQQLIEVNKLCDGFHDCLDLSDESVSLCKPDISDFTTFSAPVLTAFVAVGLIVFVVVQITNSSSTGPSILVRNEWREDIVSDILVFCNKSKTSLDEEGKESMIYDKVMRIFTPCLEYEEKLFIYQILNTLSLAPNLRDMVWLLMDTMMDMEKQVHNGDLDKAKCCLISFRKEHSYLSMFINDVIERDTLFSRLGKTVKDGFTYILLSRCVGLIVVLVVLSAFLQIGLFYYDIFRDSVMCSLLIHVRDNVLKDDDVKTRFDSVGGVNFQVLIVYLICIMVIGEIAIYWQILNREASIKERIKWFDVSLIGRIFVRLFPIHFLYLQMARAKIETMLLRRKIINTLRWNQLAWGRALAKLIIKLSNDLENLHNQSYYLNHFGSEMQIIQTALEKEPQMVIQLCIFILMQHFKRLTLLFDKSFGISTEVFFTANLVIALFSITKSIVTYLNAKRYPVRPNIFGTIIFTLAVGMLVVSKFAIVSMNLLNAFYLYPLTHVLNIFLFVLYTFLVCGKIRSSFYTCLVMPIVPAFFKSSKTRSQNLILEMYLKLLKRCGPILNTVVLHLITFSLYSVVGVILRNALFHLNIKIGFEDNEEDYIDEVFINKQNGYFPFHDTKTFTRYLFKSPLQHYPVGIAFCYQICILFYIFGCIIYYRFFHPWRQIILAKRLKGSFEDVKVDVREGYGSRTSEPTTITTEGTMGAWKESSSITDERTNEAKLIGQKKEIDAVEEQEAAENAREDDRKNDISVDEAFESTRI